MLNKAVCIYFLFFYYIHVFFCLFVCFLNGDSFVF